MVRTFFCRPVIIVGAIAWLLVPSVLAQVQRESTTANFRHSGQVLSVQKLIDPASGQESFVATDAAGNPVDYFAALRLEREAAAKPANKIVAPLPRYLEEAKGQPIVVGVWLRFDPRTVDFREDLQAQLVNGVPYDRAKTDLTARVEAANLVLLGQAHELMTSLGIPVVSMSRFAPLIFVSADAAQVAGLAELEIVNGLFANVVFHDTTTDAIDTHRWNRVHDFNIRGDGIQVAVLENNGIDDAACVYNTLNIIGWANANHNIQDHPTGCASIIGSMNGSNPGHARGIQILSANGTTAGGLPSYNTNDIITACDWSIGQGADVVNCSFGFDDTPLVLQAIDHYVDYQVRFLTTTFAISAGNNGGGTNDVSSPAVSWNCIAVGALDDNNTPNWSDDIVATYSSFDDPISTHGDREKPEVMAEGTDMTLLDLGCAFTYSPVSGTSFAAPGVAGMCGALMQMSSTLPGWPEAMKAIMMAAATHNVEGASRLSDKDGAGAENGLQAYRMVEQNKFTIGTFLPTSFTNNGYYTYNIFLQGGDKTRVCLVWDSLASGPAAYATDVLNADLDLAVFQGISVTSGVLMGSSASYDNSYEIVEFCPPATGWYTVRVNDFRFDGASEYYGLAWTQDADGRDAHFRQWLPESTTTDLIGPTIGNQFFWLDPIDFSNGGKTYVSLGSGGIGTGIDIGGCRHSYGDYDFVTALLLGAGNPWFINFTGTWSSSGTTFSHRFAIPDDPGIVGIPLYYSIVTLDPAFPDGIGALGSVEKITFWSHATDLVLGDDGSSGPINLGFSFNFYGTNYTQCYVNANGNITFGGADGTYTETLAGFTAGLPRIAPFWDDLNMNIGGKIRYRTAGNQFVVEWVNVPEFSTTTSNQNSVLCILNSDGSIEFDYHGCSLLDAIVGISPGGGATADSVDFSHGFKTVFSSHAMYEQFTGVAPSTFDLDISSSYRNKLRFTRLSSSSYRATFESP